MSQISQDDRTDERRALDDAISNGTKLPLPGDVEGFSRSSMEDHLEKLYRPVAVSGVIENGVVRLLDSSINLPEHTRVIVVATQPT